MYIVKEETVKEIFSQANAIDAVEEVFGSMASGEAYNFPVIREAIGHADALYGFKSGFDRKGLALGLKSGGYWPGNMTKGLTNHQSTIILFDANTGKPSALVGGNYLTAVRTAAASALSIKYLARKNVKTIGMIGAGHQSTFQLRAACSQRDFDRVVAWNLHPHMMDGLKDTAAELGLAYESVSREDVARQADVIITITSCFESLLEFDWIQSGTHIACMGTDTKGKQEVSADLIAGVCLFTDEVAQSISIGECQHAFSAGLIKEDQIAQLGAVINGKHQGRQNDTEITLFDGTGVGLQDLAAAAKCVEVAIAKGAVETLDF